MTEGTLEARLAALEKLVGEQQKQIQKQEDMEAIRRLQYAYNYYVEHMLGEDIINCFADDPATKLNWLEGQYCGKEGVKRYFDKAAKGENPVNFSHQLMPNTGLITIDSDTRARGRWYVFGGVYTPNEEGKVQGGGLVSGVYEMTYIKEDGIWKILQIDWFIIHTAQIASWGLPEGVGTMIIESADKIEAGAEEVSFRFPEPDIPIDRNDLRYVSGYILPHHFPHPVTGKPSTETRHNARLKPLKLD